MLYVQNLRQDTKFLLKMEAAENIMIATSEFICSMN